MTGYGIIKPMKDIDKSLAKPYTLTNILEYRLLGMTQQEIGDIYGVTPQAISLKLKGIWDILDRENLDAYKTNKVNLFTAVEAKMLQELLKPSRLKKASTGNIAYAFDKIAIHNRLEQGLSTENIAIKDVAGKLLDKANAADQDLVELEAELANETVNKPDIVDK